MAKNKQQQKNVVTGRNIFIDKLGRTVYYNKWKKQGFVIREGSELQFRAYYNRYLIGFVAIIFFEVLAFHNLVFSIPLGIAATLFMEFRWRKLIDSYTMIQNFEPEKHKSSFEHIIGLDNNALILRVILYLALSVCLVLNIYSNPEIEASLLLTIASYIMAAIALYMAGRFVYALSKKRK
ncbi:MAG: hypothetical protein EOM50_02435 [Erysipelotrichia bacterium]|nr:hypothetical protein [Erysipelotrichia bacterium]NCC55212.1 hypothetical protein [Erysipelotrichia bacterium]